MDPTREKIAGCFLAGGCATSAISGFLIWLFGMAGVFRGTYTREAVTNRITDAGTLNWVPLALTAFLLGLVLMIWAVCYGLMFDKRMTKGPRRVIEGAFIVSRYAKSPSGDFLSDWQLEESIEPKFFVRMRLPSGKSGEYLCSPETYFNCGEGMAGEAELQGRWLGRFTPYIGVPRSV